MPTLPTKARIITKELIDRLGKHSQFVRGPPTDNCEKERTTVRVQIIV